MLSLFILTPLSLFVCHIVNNVHTLPTVCFYHYCDHHYYCRSRFTLAASIKRSCSSRRGAIDHHGGALRLCVRLRFVARRQHRRACRDAPRRPISADWDVHGAGRLRCARRGPRRVVRGSCLTCWPPLASGRAVPRQARQDIGDASAFVRYMISFQTLVFLRLLLESMRHYVILLFYHMCTIIIILISILLSFVILNNILLLSTLLILSILYFMHICWSFVILAVSILSLLLW